jgi:hypothetical protein
VNNYLKKYSLNLILSFLLSIFLIYSLFYSASANNYLLVLVVTVLSFTVIPFTLKNLILKRRNISIFDIESIFAAFILIEVLFLSYYYVLPNNKASLDYAYPYFLVAIIFFSILYFREKLEILLKQNRLTTKLILLFSLIFSFYLWGPNLNSSWGLTDDHMIMHYFINNTEVSLLEVPKIIMEETEVGKFGDTTINRPFYYSGRVIESALWQKDASLWYLARVVMFFIAFSLFWILIEKWLGFLHGGVFIFFLFLSSYWAWIWGYLGPAENYAMFGSSLYLYGFFNIITRLKNDLIDKRGILMYSILLLLGSLVAIGSKENFIILTIPLVYILFVLIKKKIKSWPLIISLTAIFIYSGFIAVGTYLGLSKAGGDVYGQSIGILERLQLTFENIAVKLKEFDIIGISAVTLFAGVAIYATKSKIHLVRYKLVVKNFFLISSLLLVLYASQVFFYNGNFPPSALRYSFPGMIAFPFFWILALTTLFSALEINGFSKFMLRQTKNAVFVALLLIILTDGYHDAKAFVANNVVTTNSFSSKMASYYDHLKNNQEEAVVIDSDSVWNVEPIASIRAYLLANNVKNPMYLRLNYQPVVESSEDKIAYKIYYFLNHISNEGGCGFTGADYSFLSGGNCDQWGFEPISELKGTYFAINIDQQNEISGSEKDK